MSYSDKQTKVIVIEIGNITLPSTEETDRWDDDADMLTERS